jgi:hypothetical protein
VTTEWEYRFEPVELPGRDDERARLAATEALDTLGLEGWEAVGIAPSHAASHGLRVETTRYVVLLKRARRRESQ